MKTYKYLSMLFLGTLLMTIFFEACLKKGEDDPLVSLRTREGRLKGKWDLTKYSIAGEDMLNSENKNVNIYAYQCGYYDYTQEIQMSAEFEFDKNGDMKITSNSNSKKIYDYYNNYCNDKTETDSELEVFQGKWAFLFGNQGKKKKEQIVLHTDNTDNDILAIVYDITQLNNKNMKWETVIDGGLLEMEFKKK